MDTTRANDVGTCTKCGKREHMELLDGVLDRKGNDTGQVLDIACYGPGWAPTGIESFQFSVRPDLTPMYEAWQRDNGGR